MQAQAYDPNAPAEATKSITVSAVSLTFNIDRTWQKTGGTVTFSGKLTSDGAGWGGQTVYIIFYYGGLPSVADAVTDSGGNYSRSWTVPFSVYDPESRTYVKLPCKTWSFYAYHMASGVQSSSKSLAVAYNTRIRDFTAPDSIPANTNFEVSGYLEYENESGSWLPLYGKTVSLYYNGTKIGDVSTAGDGRFSAITKISAGGRYTLKAVYAGEGIPTAAVAALTVEQSRMMLAAGIPLIVGGLTLALAGKWR